MKLDLSGKTALVTGGAQGVGRAIVLALAEQGCDVAVGDIDTAKSAAVADEVKALGRKAIPLKMDVTSIEMVGNAVSTVLDQWGQIDILVNNAGVVGAPGWMESDEDRYEDWDMVIGVNLKGVVNVTKAVVPHMKARQYGKIISIASTAARPGGGGSRFSSASANNLTPYSVSKAGVMRYTQCLAADLAKHNINVNSVAPGPMFTEMGLNITKLRQRKDPAAAQVETETLRHQHVANATLFGRELLPEDVAHMIVMLASDNARNITGQTIPVDGGARMV